MKPASTSESALPSDPDILTTEQFAARIGRSLRWVREARKLPGRIQHGRKVLLWHWPTYLTGSVKGYKR